LFYIVISPVATAGLWWANPPKQNFTLPQIEITNTIKQAFLSTFRMSSHPSNSKPKDSVTQEIAESFGFELLALPSVA